MEGGGWGKKKSEREKLLRREWSEGEKGKWEVKEEDVRKG